MANRFELEMELLIRKLKEAIELAASNSQNDHNTAAVRLYDVADACNRWANILAKE